MEQSLKPLSENDLPRCSVGQAAALVDIRSVGGSYHFHGKLGWLPPGGPGLSKAARAYWRHTDRVILSLVRSAYLTVTQQREGRPVKVELTFP